VLVTSVARLLREDVVSVDGSSVTRLLLVEVSEAGSSVAVALLLRVEVSEAGSSVAAARLLRVVVVSVGSSVTLLFRVVESLSAEAAAARRSRRAAIRSEVPDSAGEVSSVTRDLRVLVSVAVSVALERRVSELGESVLAPMLLSLRLRSLSIARSSSSAFSSAFLRSSSSCLCRSSCLALSSRSHSHCCCLISNSRCF